MNGWLGGLQVRCLEKGQTPVADHLCTACGFYRRVTGRDKVRDYLRANPITAHRANCPAEQRAAA